MMWKRVFLQKVSKLHVYEYNAGRYLLGMA